jgi:protein-tyrosine phosphatase
MDRLRKAVSGDRRRFRSVQSRPEYEHEHENDHSIQNHQDGGQTESNMSFDLDLSYISRNIIAMAVPAAGVSSFYRNKAIEIEQFLELEHPNGTWLIFSLTETLSQKVYGSQSAQNAQNSPQSARKNEKNGAAGGPNLGDANNPNSNSDALAVAETVVTPVMADRVCHFPFADHHAPPLSVLLNCVLSVDRWLEADIDQNVAVLHCRGGKGRTGTICAGLLLLRGEESTADSAFRHFARTRGTPVTQPSQRRYVCILERLLNLTQTDLDRRWWRGMDGSREMPESISSSDGGGGGGSSSSQRAEHGQHVADDLVAPDGTPLVTSSALISSAESGFDFTTPTLPRYEVCAVRIHPIPSRWRRKRRMLEIQIAEYSPMDADSGPDGEARAEVLAAHDTVYGRPLSVRFPVRCTPASDSVEVSLEGIGPVLASDVIIRVSDAKRERMHLVFHLAFLAEATAAPAIPSGQRGLGELVLDFVGRGELDCLDRRFDPNTRVSVSLRRAVLGGSERNFAIDEDKHNLELWGQIIRCAHQPVVVADIPVVASAESLEASVGGDRSPPPSASAPFASSSLSPSSSPSSLSGSSSGGGTMRRLASRGKFAQAQVDFLELSGKRSVRAWASARAFVQRGLLRLEKQTERESSSSKSQSAAEAEPLLFPVFRGKISDVVVGKSLGLNIPSGPIQLRFQNPAEYYAVFGAIASDCGVVTRNDPRSQLDLRLLLLDAETMAPSAGRAEAVAEIQRRLDMAQEGRESCGDTDDQGGEGTTPSSSSSSGRRGGETAEEARERLRLLEEVIDTMQETGASAAGLPDMLERASKLRYAIGLPPRVAEQRSTSRGEEQRLRLEMLEEMLAADDRDLDKTEIVSQVEELRRQIAARADGVNHTMMGRHRSLVERD